MFIAIVPNFDKDKDYIRMRWIAEALMTLLTGMEKVYMYQQAYITYIEELRLKLSEKEFNDMTNAENDSNRKILDFFRERDTFMQRITDKELQAIKGFILFHHYDDNTFKNKDLYKKALERAAKDILKYDEAKIRINKRSFNKFVNVLNSYKTVEDIEKKLNESNIIIEDEHRNLLASILLLRSQASNVFKLDFNNLYDTADRGLFDSKFLNGANSFNLEEIGRLSTVIQHKVEYIKKLKGELAEAKATAMKNPLDIQQIENNIKDAQNAIADLYTEVEAIKKDSVKTKRDTLNMIYNLIPSLKKNFIDELELSTAKIVEEYKLKINEVLKGRNKEYLKIFKERRARYIVFRDFFNSERYAFYRDYLNGVDHSELLEMYPSRLGFRKRAQTKKWPHMYKNC